MIENIVATESKKKGAAFSLKGISDKSKFYYLHIADYIKEKITENYNQFIQQTGSPFSDLLTIDPGRKISHETYLKAVDQLLGENVIPVDIKAKFELLGQLNSIEIQWAELFADYFKYSICCWKFGKGKQYLEEGALRQGFSLNQIKGIIELINDELEDIQ